MIRDVHSQIALEHPGNQKTINLITQNYYWPGLKKMVQRYIQNCHYCRHAIALKDQYNVLFKPLPISFCPWTDITLAFVTGLSISDGYNAILIIVDYLTKERHYILYTINENGTTTETTIQLLFPNI